MSSVLPSSNDIIMQTKDIDVGIYVKEQKGYYQKVRRVLGTLLVLLFITIPFINYQGSQAVIFDVGQQKLQLFSLTLFPQDLFVFALAFAFSAFALFWVSTKYGRVWCGYACPQTIWTMAFMWFEFRIEGNRQQRMRLDKADLSAKKVALKFVKHSSWTIIATLTAIVFMSYFVPAREIYVDFLTLELPALIQGWIAFFAICTYINAGWVREKMCEHMCPYSRFQSVMFNAETKVIAYDKVRGENRGARRMNKEKPDQLGDCVDCNLCVQVCPVGIDIRDGLQYQCISCGLCIDACDETMRRFGYKEKLISYVGEVKGKLSKSAKVAYTTLLVVIVAAFFNWVNERSNFEVSVIKDRNSLFTVNQNGHVKNSYQLKLLNKSTQDARIKISLVESELFSLDGDLSIYLSGNDRRVLPFTIMSKSGYSGGNKELHLKLISIGGVEEELIIQTRFHANN